MKALGRETLDSALSNRLTQKKLMVSMIPPVAGQSVDTDSMDEDALDSILSRATAMFGVNSECVEPAHALITPMSPFSPKFHKSLFYPTRGRSILD